MFFWPLVTTHRCSFDLWPWLIDVLLTFGHVSSMFFWPLVMTHRGFVDLWTWLIEVLLTFSFDVFLTLTQTHTHTYYFFFIWPSLQSRELKSMFFWPLNPHLTLDSDSPTPITQGPTKFWPSMTNNYYLLKSMFFWPWCKHTDTHTNYFFSYDPPYSRGNFENLTIDSDSRIPITQGPTMFRPSMVNYY